MDKKTEIRKSETRKAWSLGLRTRGANQDVRRTEFVGYRAKGLRIDEINASETGRLTVEFQGSALGHGNGLGKSVLVIVREGVECDADLAEIRSAKQLSRPGSCLRNGGKQESGENANDGHDDQQFDQREAVRGACGM
jgi:hypothetical protein